MIRETVIKKKLVHQNAIPLPSPHHENLVEPNVQIARVRNAPEHWILPSPPLGFPGPSCSPCKPQYIDAFHILSWSDGFFSGFCKPFNLDNRPFRTRWMKSIIASFSWTPWLLKCFRTVLVKCIFVWRRCSFFLAMVGEYKPRLPGCVRTQER